MSGSDQTKANAQTTGQASSENAVTVEPAFSASPMTPSTERDFDWLAMGVVILLAAIFAVAARLNAQPASSLTPAAVLSATGCGLLITALRKLRTTQRPGLFEAALGGLFLVLAQFLAAITYPTAFYTITTNPDERLGFLTTWALVAGFSILFSMAGAALGHLAFAPLRPLPSKKVPLQAEDLSEPEDSTIEDEQAVEKSGEETIHSDGEEVEESGEDSQTVEQEDVASRSVLPVSPARPFISYFIVVLLLGLAPTVVAYVFSAAFDYMLSAYHFFAGPYPTLRLLSTLLPWQIPIQIDLNANNPNSTIFLLWLLWRIPLFLGNPTMFDVQALEPFVFNGAALALLLLIMYGRDDKGADRPIQINWSTYLLLEAALGFILVLPADLWFLKGLLGLLQIDVLNLVVQIRTLHIIDPFTFTLNLITGPLVCVATGILIRRQYRHPLKTR